MDGACSNSTPIGLISGCREQSNATESGAHWFIIFGVPLAVVVLIMCVSPNFDAANRIRNTPLGGDFVQDWVGAQILLSPDRARLYDPDHSRMVQHDPAVVAFEWPLENYYPMVYPPFFYAFLTPLAALPYFVAVCLWMVFLAASIGMTFWVLQSNLPATRRHMGKFMLGAMVFAPMLTSLNLAHKSVGMLLILTSTYILLFNRRYMAAGLVFGLIAFKPHVGIVIALAMLAKRQWSFVFGSAITVCTLIGVSLLIGTDVSYAYLQQCLSMGSYIQNGGYELNQAVSLWGATQLLLPDVSPAVVKFIACCAALIVMVIVGRSFRGPVDTRSPEFALQFSSLVLATPLLCPHFYLYDLTIALLPLMLIAMVLFGGNQFKFRLHPGTRMTLLYGATAMLIGAGTFPVVAGATGVQPAVVLILVLLIAIGFAVLRISRQDSPAATSICR